MYDLLAISAGDSAALVSAVAAVGLLLGGLHSRILTYVLGIQNSISEIKVDIAEVKGRTVAIEKAVAELKAWKETL